MIGLELLMIQYWQCEVWTLYELQGLEKMWRVWGWQLDNFEWCEIRKDCKKLSDYCKECNKIYEDWILSWLHGVRKINLFLSVSSVKKKRQQYHQISTY